MNATPKLSIVVPCYKTEKYLPRCLDSLLAQTLDGLEIICVNDGSPDDTLALLESYEARHPEIIRVVDRENGGLRNARWSGTDVVRGEYVAYVDSDDYVDSDFAASFWAAARHENADIVVCGFRRTDEETGKVVSVEMAEARDPFIPREDPGSTITVNPAAWNKAFKRELLERMNRLSVAPPVLEDVALSQLAFLATKRPVAFTGCAAYNYMVHKGSMISTITEEQVKGVRDMFLEIRGIFLAGGASQKQLAALDATVFLHLGISMSFRLSCNPKINLGRAFAVTTDYLDASFPTWRNSPYINFGYAKERGGAFKKLLLSQYVYKAHLMRPFLACYRFAINHGINVMW